MYLLWKGTLYIACSYINIKQKYPVLKIYSGTGHKITQTFVFLLYMITQLMYHFTEFTKNAWMHAAMGISNLIWVVIVWKAAISFNPKASGEDSMQTLCRENVRLITGSLLGETASHQCIFYIRSVCRVFMFARASCWTSNGVAGDLRRHDTHMSSQWNTLHGAFWMPSELLLPEI